MCRVGCKHWGLLVIRIALAIIFIYGGLIKMQDMQATIGVLDTIGLSAFWAYAVSIIGIVGGISMLLGLLTGISGVALATIMLFAIILLKSKMGGFSTYQGDFMIMMSALGIAMAGPGKWALARNCKCDAASGQCGCIGCKGACDECDTCKGGICTGHEKKG